jgi:hypothetical protein
MAQRALQAVDAPLTAARFASAMTTAVILPGQTRDVTVVWRAPFPTDNYTAEPEPGPGLTSATLAVKSTTRDSCVITVTGTVAVPAGSVLYCHGYATGV